MGRVEAEADVVETRQVADGGQLGLAFVELPVELGQVGVGDVGSQLGGEAVEVDVAAMQVFEDVAQVGEADAEMRLVLPATAVVGAQGRAEKLDGDAEAVAVDGAVRCVRGPVHGLVRFMW